MADLDIAALVHPTPRQEEFIRKVFANLFTLYGGAAGGGKSYILRWMLVILHLHWFKALGIKNIETGLFCETYRALHDRHLKKVKSEFPSWLGDFHEQSCEFRLKEEFGGGVICFRNLDDPGKYDSNEYGAIAVDELTKNGPEVFHELRKRLRWPGVEFSPFFAGTNPGEKGHAWVKRLWIDLEPDLDEDGDVNPKDFAFVQAKVSDNPYAPKSYLRTLESLPPDLRRRFLEGDWDIWEGQYFSEWRQALHVCQPFEIPREWRRWRSVDYGTYNPFCCLWLTIDPGNGRRYVYRELYQKGLTATLQAEQILELSGNEPIQYTVADPTMAHNTIDEKRGMASPFDHYREAGVVLRKGYNARVSGWNNVRQALALREDGEPGLKVFSTCKNLIRTLPMMIHDNNHPEDLNTDLEDHAVDALRYGLSPTMIEGRKPMGKPKGYAIRRLVAVR